MKSGFLLIGLVLLLAFSGCVKQDVSNEASQLPEIRAVLGEYPNAYIVTLFMRKDVVSLVIDDIRADCPGLEPASYWYVTLNVGQRAWEFYVDEQVSKVVCAIYPESAPLDECKSALECDDFDAGTKNECSGSPMKCVYTPIAACINGDGFCPAGCDYANDSDCPAVDTCQADAECNDSNSLTIDACIGTPKHCVHSLKSCAEIRGYECAPYEECLGGTLPVSSGSVCCETACTKTKSCTGIVCEDMEKCINGLCVKKSCAELELKLCNTSEACTGSTYVDGFDIRCCTGECILKTCKQRNGAVCNANEGLVCLSSTVETLDQNNCCVSACVEPCLNELCAINKKCVNGVCELKTCAEIAGGVDWPSQESCLGDFYDTEGILDCCIPKACAELGGLECLAGEVCGGTIRKSTDVESCCVGECLAAP